jgi:hypothetical protein
MTCQGYHIHETSPHFSMKKAGELRHSAWPGISMVVQTGRGHTKTALMGQPWRKGQEALSEAVKPPVQFALM